MLASRAAASALPILMQASSAARFHVAAAARSTRLPQHRRAGNPRGILFGSVNFSTVTADEEPPSKRARHGSGSASGVGVIDAAPDVDAREQTGTSANREAVLQAYRSGKLGFSFSAGGLLFPYYIGVVMGLQDAGVLTGPAQLAGASAGSLIAACYNAGMDMGEVKKYMLDFGEDVLQNGVRTRLGPLLRDFLHGYLPHDAHERCSGTTHVAQTRVLPFWRPQIISHFHSRDDLIDALLTSCHIPYYFDGRWMTKFRGHYCIDGGAYWLTNFIPRVPTADYSVKVCCFPTWHLDAIQQRAAKMRMFDKKAVEAILQVDVSPDKYENWPYDMQQVLKWALQASTSETANYLIDKGKKDAGLWLEACGLADLLREQAKEQHRPQPVLHVQDICEPPHCYPEEPQPRSPEKAAIGKRAEERAGDRAEASAATAETSAQAAAQAPEEHEGPLQGVKQAVKGVASSAAAVAHEAQSAGDTMHAIDEAAKERRKHKSAEE